MSRIPLQNILLQDQLIANLVEALTSQRTSPSYSTSCYWNEQVLIIAKELLETANASLSTLLRRIIQNATWFGRHYKTQLSFLQHLEAQQSVQSTRRDLAMAFERDRGARPELRATAERQAERQENELRAEARRRLGPETTLRSHPIRKVEGGAEQPRQELVFRLEPPKDVIQRQEVELEIEDRLRAGKGFVIEGVDEDMITAF